MEETVLKELVRKYQGKCFCDDSLDKKYGILRFFRIKKIKPDSVDSKLLMIFYDKIERNSLKTYSGVYNARIYIHYSPSFSFTGCFGNRITRQEFNEQLKNVPPRSFGEFVW